MSHSKGARFGTQAMLLACLSACGGDADEPDLEAQVARQYALILDAMYKDSIVGVEALKVRIDDFVAEPSAEGLEAAKEAWLAARPPYGEVEVSRFYGGPMDYAQGAMNEWPIDENYIDYTAINPEGGVINDPEQFPDISPSLLASLVARGGTENYATGYHAIEYMLWGQRLDQLEGPGNRSYTDFVDGGTAMNQDRRRKYLETITLMLLEALRAVDAEWDLSDEKSYGAKFVAGDPHEAVTLIYRGFSQQLIAEILYERLAAPFLSKDRKDEQSCFSESTWEDLVANMRGTSRVYVGDYGKLKGPGLGDLIVAKDPDVDKRMRARFELIRDAIDDIIPPLDHAILADPSSEEYMRVEDAVDSFEPLLDLLREGSDALDIVNNL